MVISLGSRGGDEDRAGRRYRFHLVKNRAGMEADYEVR